MAPLPDPTSQGAVATITTTSCSLPLAAGMLVPKGYAVGDDYEFFGYTAQEQAELP